MHYLILILVGFEEIGTVEIVEMEMEMNEVMEWWSGEVME